MTPRILMDEPFRINQTAVFIRYREADRGLSKARWSLMKPEWMGCDFVAFKKLPYLIYRCGKKFLLQIANEEIEIPYRIERIQFVHDANLSAEQIAALGVAAEDYQPRFNDVGWLIYFSKTKS